MPNNSIESLPLDIEVPSFALKRRYAISFPGSGSDSPPRLLRRPGLGSESDQNVRYIPMIGDALEGSLESVLPLLSSNDLQTLEGPGLRRRLKHRSRFHSLHKRRRRQQPLLMQCADSCSQGLVDCAYSEQAKHLLTTSGTWDFNVLNLNRLTNGRALFHIALHLFNEHQLIDHFQLDVVKLMQCITLIEEGYHNNPYHNSVHAADVTQALHCYLLEEKIRTKVQPLERMMALIAAMTHDLDHPGVNQAFLTATKNHLAQLYDNQSVLEHHHWRSAVAVLRETDLLSHLPFEQKRRAEADLKSLILATDITRQQQFLKQFKIGLKCADICNPCRPWELSRRWSEMVCDEFFKQGDTERSLQLPVTPLCDRHITTVAKVQTGFMQFVVLPLFKEWDTFMRTALSSTMLENTRQNLKEWEVVVRNEEKHVVDDWEDDDDKENRVEDEKAPLLAADEAESPTTGRRHSLPQDLGLALWTGRESFPFANPPAPSSGLGRRHSLPVSMEGRPVGLPGLSALQSVPVAKLATLKECSPTNGNKMLSVEDVLPVLLDDDLKSRFSEKLDSGEVRSMKELLTGRRATEPFASPHRAARKLCAVARNARRRSSPCPLHSRRRGSFPQQQQEPAHLLKMMTSHTAATANGSRPPPGAERPRSLSLQESRPPLAPIQGQQAVTSLENIVRGTRP